VAIRYNSYETDLLGGIDIYFNQLMDSVNLDYFFKLMVWDESDERPGPPIWEDENDHTPTYTSSLLGFKRYYFSRPVEVDGPFYVGWKQYNEFMLNVGLDLNNKPVPQVMYHNFQGSWQPSKAPGVIMFRPFLYREISGDRSHRIEPSSLLLYPNPATDRIHFQLPGSDTEGTIQFEIFDQLGRKIDHDEIRTRSRDVTSLEVGIYHIRVRSGDRSYSGTFLIRR
jgi:hypothetical protein